MRTGAIRLQTERRRQAVDITGEVNRHLSGHRAEEGLCLLFLQHTTAALAVGEVGEGTEEDFLEVLSELIPKIRFRHAHDPSHAPSHMISSILGPSLSLPVSSRRLALGTWQSAMLIELDGPKERTIQVTFLRSDPA